MIGIIAAMPVELEALKKRMTQCEELIHGPISFTKGLLSNKEVVLMQSGVGKVSTAIRVTVLIEQFKPELLINIGSAGSLKSDIRVGDVVIATKVAHHDIFVPGWPKGFDQDKTCYKADEKAIEVCKTLKTDLNCHFGPMTSGDSFICEVSQTDKILKEFPESLCVEMEANAVGQTATFYNIPFLILRSMSDVAIEEGNEVVFEEFVAVASEHSAAYCEAFVGEY